MLPELWFRFAAMALVISAVAIHAATHQVNVEDSFFDPPQLAINVGDTVLWVGNGAQDHTVTADDALFDSLVLYGETFFFTFTAEGAFPYYCANHGGAGGSGMSGQIIVSPSGPNQSPNTPL